MTRRCGACDARVTAGAAFCRRCGVPIQPLTPDDAGIAAEASAPPGDAGFGEVRRVLEIFGLLLAANIVLNVLAALDVALEPVLDAWCSAAAAAVVSTYAWRDRARLVRWLSPRLIDLRRAHWLALGAVPFVLALELYFSALRGLNVPMFRYLTPYEDAGWPLWSAFLMICLIPAVFEELAFRGVIYDGLGRVMSRRDALLVQAMAFSVLHLSPLIFVSHFLLGLSFGILRDTTRSLYPCVAAHAGWNALVLFREISATAPG